MLTMEMKRVLLLASFVAGSLTAAVGDPDPVDKELSLIDRTIIEEILNSRRSKSVDNSWYEMMNRNPYWSAPWLMAPTGMAYGCPCAPNAFVPMMGAPLPPPLFSNPYYGMNRYPPPLESPTSASTDFQTRVVSDLPYTPLVHPQPVAPAEESAQQIGLIKAIRSRFKAEIAAIANKINPVEPTPPPPPSTTVQQTTTTTPSPTTFIVRPSLASQRSPAAVQAQSSPSAYQQSRTSTKSIPRP